ncbi:MAG: hypothetical protein KGL39_53685 [Patescibacteria group bacterium]|nr:hypothetical protein [Patescibacteria group bacterium]
MALARGRWKRHERQTMQSLGGKRYPSQGTDYKDGDDGETGWLTVEHKTRLAMPIWLHKAFLQSDGNYAREPMRLPLVVLAVAPGVPGKRVERYYMMREKYFKEWFGE